MIGESLVGRNVKADQFLGHDAMLLYMGRLWGERVRNAASTLHALKETQVLMPDDHNLLVFACLAQPLCFLVPVRNSVTPQMKRGRKCYRISSSAFFPVSSGVWFCSALISASLFFANASTCLTSLFLGVLAKYAEFNGVNTVTVSSLDGETETWVDKICRCFCVSRFPFLAEQKKHCTLEAELQVFA